MRGRVSRHDDDRRADTREVPHLRRVLDPLAHAPALRNVPSCSTDWMALPFRRRGIEWNPIASVRPRANRTMYCIVTFPPCPVVTGERENTE